MDRKQSENTLWSNLAQGAALITALAALTYTLGVVALWIPIARAYTGDYSTALYAASLVPRTVVIGQGVRVWFGPALYATAMLTILTVLRFRFTKPLYDYLEKRFGDNRDKKLLLLTLWLTWIVAFLYLCGAILLAYKLHLDLSPHKPLRAMDDATLMWTLVSSAISILGVLSVVAYAWHREGGSFQVPDPDAIRHPKAWLAGLRYAALIFVIVMVASFPAAAAKDPPLPTVEINGTDRMEGHLLAHSEATWYVFDSEGVLLAIPDDKVETVRVLPPKE